MVSPLSTLEAEFPFLVGYVDSQGGEKDTAPILLLLGLTICQICS